MQMSVSKDRWPQAILLSLPLAFAIFVATYSWRVNTRLSDDYAQVTRSYAITASVVAVMGRVTDGETMDVVQMVLGGLINQDIVGLKAGDRVTTSGGIRGIILSIKEDVIIIRVAPDSLKLEIAKNAIASVTTQDASSE